MQNLLCIVPQDYIPYTDGGKMDLFFQLKEISKYFNIFCAFPTDKIENDTIQKYKENSITAIPYQTDMKDNYFNYPKTIFSNLSFKYSKFYNKKFLEIIDRVVKENDINTIWTVYSQVGKYAVELKKRHPDLKIFLREGNIEYKLVKQYSVSQKNIFMKLISYFEYLKTKNYEINLWSKFDKVFFISDSDLNTAKIFKKDFDESNLLYAGFQYDNDIELTDTEENSFIFTGSLKTFQNEKSLKNFIKNIWVSFVKKVPEAKLYLTGNKDDFLLSKLKMTKRELEENNIINLGFVDDIKKTILSKQFVVSPTLYGSGIRIKVLEALSLKKVVFVSDIDYEMAKCFKDMENIVHYSNIDDFYKKYKKIIHDNKYSSISENGFKLIGEYFNWSVYSARVLNEIDKKAG